MKLKSIIYFIFCIIVCNYSIVLNAQCTAYTQNSPSVIPDNCSNALDINSLINTCKVTCINMSLATATSTIPSCGSGSVTNDIWYKSQDPYTNIASYDGSWVFAWKKYPDFPDHMPTMATHAEISGSVTYTFLPIPLSINCSDGFQSTNLTCLDDSVTHIYDNQVVLLPNTIPTNLQIKDALIADPNITNATVNNSISWTQIETYNNVPGIVCFEVSTYKTGFQCGSPKVLTYSGTGTSETKTQTKCLCSSAQNSGYFTPTNIPCGFIAGNIFTGTTAFYQLNAPYACNQIEVKLNTWAGAGSVNVAILSDLTCPPIPVDSSGIIVNKPGLVVSSANSKAQGCMLANDIIATSSTQCLDAGTYYIAVMGNTDKSTFSIDITVKSITIPSPTVTVMANALLEGAFNTTTQLMNTTLKTNNFLPLTQPYNTAPWNYAGTESVPNAAEIPANVVDWVLLEALDMNLTSVQKVALFVKNDGTLVDVTGSNTINMPLLVNSNFYYFVIRHRNHLAAISNTMLQVPITTPFDFTVAANTWNATTQLKNVTSTKYALKAGDCSANGIFSYLDYNIYRNSIGNYTLGDCNLDGTINATDYTLFKNNAATIGIKPIRY